MPNNATYEDFAAILTLDGKLHAAVGTAGKIKETLGWVVAWETEYGEHKQSQVLGTRDKAIELLEEIKVGDGLVKKNTRGSRQSCPVRCNLRVERETSDGFITEDSDGKFVYQNMRR